MKGLAPRAARRGARALLALAALSLPLALPAHATTFTDGEFVTWSQVAWGDDPFCGPTACNISGILESDFNSVFAPSDLLELGVPGAGGFSMIFDSADAIIAYLPESGNSGPLTADLLDPVRTASGALGARSSPRRSMSRSRQTVCWRIRPASRSATSCFRTSNRSPAIRHGEMASARRLRNSTAGQ